MFVVRVVLVAADVLVLAVYLVADVDLAADVDLLVAVDLVATVVPVLAADVLDLDIAVLVEYSSKDNKSENLYFRTFVWPGTLEFGDPAAEAAHGNQASAVASP